MPVRGIRGATTADSNTADEIVDATRELLQELVRLNEIDVDEVAFCYLTTTPDLDAEFPALGARRLGWVEVPLLCGHDMNVPMPNPRAIPRCIRILLLYNTTKRQSQMRHAYLRGAQAIKADLEQYKEGAGAYP